MLAVACARNEELQIERCLRNLIAGFDVVLVDHASQKHL